MRCTAERLFVPFALTKASAHFRFLAAQPILGPEGLEDGFTTISKSKEWDR